MMRRWLLATTVILTTFTLSPAHADIITIDFESIADQTPAGALYAAQGVTFSSGLIVVSGAFGGSLNEVDFPPAVPGQGVFLNQGDTTTLLFSQPILSLSALFTYGGPLTLNFYAAGGALLTTLSSAFQANIGSGGDPGSSPNEVIAAASLADAVRVDIVSPGADFTLDDLTFAPTAAVADVPEPAPGLLLAGLAALVWIARHRRARLASALFRRSA